MKKGKTVALYEHIFLARQDIAPQQIDQLVEQYKNVIEANGGRVGRIENWGLRPVAYRIRKNRKAYYSLMNIDAPVTAIAEMERQMRINEDVLRFLTVRVESHEEGPSIVLSRREREERSGKDDERSRRPRRMRDNDSSVTGEDND
ncbi:MAG: small subunit ribosomal protein S6 [Candidatus Tokpelaia sp. JSC188]|nr:MAG: small subunit ribosomal protein S6 [Candidatus Tokpelaia sp. JSC188]